MPPSPIGASRPCSCHRHVSLLLAATTGRSRRCDEGRLLLLGGRSGATWAELHRRAEVRWRRRPWLGSPARVEARNQSSRVVGDHAWQGHHPWLATPAMLEARGRGRRRRCTGLGSHCRRSHSGQAHPIGDDVSGLARPVALGCRIRRCFLHWPEAGRATIESNDGRGTSGGKRRHRRTTVAGSTGGRARDFDSE
ncbi:hypothetical protein PR202_gb14682 [Eleusine coracana subsp. coracana]|uniref:Uncharacterized protein n=1 Tax=Eleusine coracana subsp. coracana TaxID=191504 RepID=A0AAV5EWX5_ELECO|nr:hypothetical protein PR202_gb14682 [Eleusine coracana subsp. coracana]